MAYWLIKSEPSAWSWDQQIKAKVTPWNGVRNFQANNNLKLMKPGDQCFFYHSNDGKEIVGIAEVTRAYYPDPADETGKFGMVDVRAVKPLPRPVTLIQIKAESRLQDMAFVRQSRLSVSPVTATEWKIITKMGGGA